MYVRYFDTWRCSISWRSATQKCQMYSVVLLVSWRNQRLIADTENLEKSKVWDVPPPRAGVTACWKPKIHVCSLRQRCSTRNNCTRDERRRKMTSACDRERIQGLMIVNEVRINLVLRERICNWQQKVICRHTFWRMFKLRSFPIWFLDHTLLFMYNSNHAGLQGRLKFSGIDSLEKKCCWVSFLRVCRSR